MAHLDRVGKAGQHICIQSVEPDAPRAHGFDKFRAPFLRSLPEVTLNGKEAFKIPFVTRLRRIVARLTNEFKGGFNIVPLLAFDNGLKVCVTDIVVRIGEEIERPFRYGLYRDISAVHRMAVDVEPDRDCFFRIDGPDRKHIDIRTDVKRLFHDPFARGDNLDDSSRTKVVEAQAKRLGSTVLTPDESGFGAQTRSKVEPVLKCHIPLGTPFVL